MTLIWVKASRFFVVTGIIIIYYYYYSKTYARMITSHKGISDIFCTPQLYGFLRQLGAIEVFG